jgi:hypothetical protein
MPNTEEAAVGPPADWRIYAGLQLEERAIERVPKKNVTVTASSFSWKEKRGAHASGRWSLVNMILDTSAEITWQSFFSQNRIQQKRCSTHGTNFFFILLPLLRNEACSQWIQRGASLKTGGSFLTHLILKSVCDFFFSKVLYDRSAEKACRNSQNRFFFCTQECWHIKRRAPKGQQKSIQRRYRGKGVSIEPLVNGGSRRKYASRWHNSNVRGLRKSPDLLRSGQFVVSFWSVNISWVLSGLGDLKKKKVKYRDFWNLVKFRVFLEFVICGLGKISRFSRLHKVSVFWTLPKFALFKTYNDAVTSHPFEHSGTVRTVNA